MADFKLVGGQSAVSNDAGVMTQGLGFPLRHVDIGPSGLDTSTIMEARDFTAQEPDGTDNPLQVTFGPLQNVPEFSLSAAGLVTCLIAGSYNFVIKLEFGRATNPGVAIVVARFLFNGFPIGGVISATLPTISTVIPSSFLGTVPLSVGDTLAMELLRDSAGNDSGGLYPLDVTLAGWASSSSTSLVITRVDAQA